MVNPNNFSSRIEQLLSISEVRWAPLGSDNLGLKSLLKYKRLCYFVGVVYLTPFRINMLILTIFSLASSLRSLEKPNSNVHVRVSSWTYKYWHLTGNQPLAEEVFSRQKKSGEKMANPRVPLFLQCIP
jgi:hypothetical protein